MKYISRIITFGFIVVLSGAFPKSYAQTHNTGASLTEIANLVGISEWHAAGVYGQGVKIGILDVGFADIDSTGIPYIAPEEQNDFILNNAPTNHGTLVVETIHYLAPQAELYIYQLQPDERNIINGVDWLITQDVDVVNFSAITLNIPMDGTNFLAQQMGRLVDFTDTVVVSAAGNFGYSFLQDTFRDTNNDGWHEFNTGTPYIEATALLTTPYSQTNLRWQDDYTSATIDLDLYIFGANGELIDAGIEVQQGGEADWSHEDVLHPTVATTPIYIAIKAKSIGQVPSETRFYLFANDKRLNRWSETGSIAAPADSPKVLAVGGLDTEIEIWLRSGRGPTWDGRIKPDLVAPVRVELSNTLFMGTSASTTIVTASVAILRSALTDLTEAQIRAWFQNNAIDLGQTGADNIYGYGRLYMPPPAR